MVKMASRVKIRMEDQKEPKYIQILRELIPHAEIRALEHGSLAESRYVDLVARVSWAGVEKTLYIDVKSSMAPALIERAAAYLHSSIRAEPSAYYVIAAPYISPRTMSFCRERGVGCIDLLGNCYLSFDNVYVDRRVEGKPASERRMLRSLFSPVSSRVLRAMLEEPKRQWRLAELAGAADASLGLVYKVSERLCTEGFAEKERRFGIRLSDPSGLLDTWREEYDFVGLNQVYSFHSPERNPDRLMDRIRSASEMLGAGYGLTLHAGASLVAPHVRFSDVHFYFEGNLDAWVDAVGLSLVEMGGNTHLIKPYDAGVFYAKHDVGGRSVVANVQLYLDLWNYPARGREQAQYLRENEIRY